VRFQPRMGQLLAVAAGNTVNIIDIEKDTSLHSQPKVRNRRQDGMLGLYLRREVIFIYLLMNHCFCV
jgi:hypothetical protein